MQLVKQGAKEKKNIRQNAWFLKRYGWKRKSYWESICLDTLVCLVMYIYGTTGMWPPFSTHRAKFVRQVLTYEGSLVLTTPYTYSSAFIHFYARLINKMAHSFPYWTRISFCFINTKLASEIYHFYQIDS